MFDICIYTCYGYCYKLSVERFHQRFKILLLPNLLYCIYCLLNLKKYMIVWLHNLRPHLAHFHLSRVLNYSFISIFHGQICFSSSNMNTLIVKDFLLALKWFVQSITNILVRILLFAFWYLICHVSDTIYRKISKRSRISNHLVICFAICYIIFVSTVDYFSLIWLSMFCIFFVIIAQT
jgi:hypothetical protein